MPPAEEQKQADQPDAAPAADAAQASAAAAQPAADKPAESGAAATPEAPKSSLEAVKRVMESERTAAEVAAKSADKPPADVVAKPADKGAEAAAGAEKPGDSEKPLTKDEFEALPDKTRRYINRLYKESKTAQAQAERAAPTVKAFTELQNWIGNQGIGQDEFTFGLSFMSAVRNDPVRAWNMLQESVMPLLRRHVGEELPADLEQDVSEGRVTKERAQELARERSERIRLQRQGAAREEATRRANETAEAQQRHQELTTEVTNALAGYENQWKGSDPDYAKKSPRVWECMVTIMQKEGTPRTREEAVALIKKARSEVEDWMQGFMPAAKPKETLPSGGANVQTRTQPKSSLDAARAAIAA